MALAEEYVYRGSGVATPNRPVPLQEHEIDDIIEQSLSIYINKAKTDNTVKVQLEQLSASLKRDLRRLKVCPDVPRSTFVSSIKSSLLDTSLLIRDQIGTKSASATTVDLTQMVISEKRGGDGKNSGLAVVSQFDELTTISDNRKENIIWAYPVKKLSNDDYLLLKRNLIGVKLSEVINVTRTVKYGNELPDWYMLLDDQPPAGYHTEIVLNLIRMANRGVLMSHVVETIKRTMDSRRKQRLKYTLLPIGKDKLIYILVVEPLFAMLLLLLLLTSLLIRKECMLVVFLV